MAASVAPVAPVQLPDATFCCKDSRGDAVPALRLKERRVKYKNVNPNLIGKPRWKSLENLEPYMSFMVKGHLWTEGNKFKMGSPYLSQRDPERHQKIRACRRADSLQGNFPGHKRKTSAAAWKKDLPADEHDLDGELYDDPSAAGVTYSYDARSGPSQGADIFGYLVEAAEMKYESEVFEKLIKNEYDVVDSEDSEEDFELI